jgi:hypothetical protein
MRLAAPRWIGLLATPQDQRVVAVLDDGLRLAVTVGARELCDGSKAQQAAAIRRVWKHYPHKR